MKLLKLGIVYGTLVVGTMAGAQTFLVEKTARPAPTALLTALANDPGSDLSGLTIDDLAAVAALEAQAYYAAHSRSYTFADYPIGEKRALGHHLAGRAVERYCVAFFTTLNFVSN